MPIAKILILCPPAIEQPKGSIAPKFEGAREKSIGLAAAFKQVAEDYRCEFFDAETITASSVVDGVHLDADQHHILGDRVAGVVKQFDRLQFGLRE